MKQTINDIFKILEPRERRRFIKLSLGDVVISMLDIAFLAGLLFIIQFYTASGNANNLWFGKELVNRSPILLIALFLALFTVKNFFAFQLARFQYQFRADVASRLSGSNMRQYLEGSFHDFVNVDSSVQVRKISQQPIEFCHYLLGGVQQIICQVVLITITVVAILIYNPFLFVVLLALLTPPVIITGFLMKQKLNRLRETAKPVSEKAQQFLREGLAGFVEGNIYDRNDFLTRRYSIFQRKYNHFLSDQQSIQNLPSRLIEVFAVLGLLILVSIHVFTSESASIPLLTIGAFMGGAYKIIPGIVKILNSAGQIKTYAFTLRDLVTPPEQNRQRPATGEKPLVIQSLECRNVTFGYNGKNILKNLSIQMHSGELVGFSDKSGSGKSTIIHLITGFLQPREGQVLINDICLTTEVRTRYWNSIAYVKQQEFLLHDTVSMNITLSDQADHVKLNHAVKAAGLDHLVKSLPAGLQTVLTENGKNLSGGQRQLIMLARALYKEASLIILDEPFNELDSEKEDELMHTLENLAREGKMILLVTHRASSLHRCTKIISFHEN